MKIVILGAVGSMAIECTRDLIQTGQFDQVILADTNLDLLRETAGATGDPRVSVRAVDARHKDDLRAVMRGCDLFINGMPSHLSATVTEVAIELGVNGTDITGLRDMFRYDNAAARKGCLIVAGLGCTPGITNVLARYGHDRLEQAEEITVYFAAWRPIGLSPGLVDFTIWAFHPDTLERCYYEDGRFVPVEPFSGRRRVKFMDPIGEQWVYYLPHQETITIPRHLDCRRVATLGTYPPDDMMLFKYLWKYGFLRDQPLEGTDYSPLDLVRRHLKQAPEARIQPTRHYALLVEVGGFSKGRRLIHRLAASHPPMDQWGGSSVYAKFTGIPLSVGSQMLARGEIKGKGVLAPEACIPPQTFFDELQKRGIVFDFESQSDHI
jgi:lysine 6-dehydrogenase